MIQFIIVLLMLLIGHPLASAQTPTRVMSGYAATSGTACGVMDCP